MIDHSRCYSFSMAIVSPRPAPSLRAPASFGEAAAPRAPSRPSATEAIGKLLGGLQPSRALAAMMDGLAQALVEPQARARMSLAAEIVRIRSSTPELTVADAIPLARANLLKPR